MVGFWNLSGHALRLRVDGRDHRIASGETLKLEVGRQFVWRVDDREPQSEQIPAQAPALEIVIRR
jgi:hypothetical protein